ncbi:hypothetical protein V8C86DRAFT_1341839 [Haematococcus lacustris]
MPPAAALRWACRLLHSGWWLGSAFASSTGRILSCVHRLAGGLLRDCRTALRYKPQFLHAVCTTFCACGMPCMCGMQRAAWNIMNDESRDAAVLDWAAVCLPLGYLVAFSPLQARS